MRKYRFFLIIGFVLFSCSPGKKIEEEKIKLPPTPVLSIRSNWGVVKSDFLRIREEPKPTATILAHLRKGSVLSILLRTEQRETVEDETSYWYQVSYEGLRGWVFGAYLEILDTRAQAETFAGELQ